MGFLDKKGLQTLTNKIIAQGGAIKVASHRGHTITNVIDNIQRECDNVAVPNTMSIENRVSDFKIGKGSDIDVSGDVEEGKVEVELEGKTYQNLKGKFSLKIGNGVVVETNGDIVATKGNWSIDYEANTIKPNTKYTFLVNLENVTSSSNIIIGILGGLSGWNIYRVFSVGGFYLFTLTTRDENISATGIRVRSSYPSFNNTEGVIIKDLFVLEGDHTQTLIEELPQYFEGIQSSFEDGIVDVEVQGKNIIDFNFDRLVEANVNMMSLSEQQGETCLKINYLHNTLNLPMEFNVVEGEYYRVSLMAKSDRKAVLYLGFDDKDTGVPWYVGALPYKGIGNISTNFVKYTSIVKCTKTTTVNKFGIVSHSDGNTFIKPNTLILEKVSKEANNTSSYEPFYKKKISFNIGDSLRSLPNGICDEIRNNNGQWELVRRIGKVILDGTHETVRSAIDHQLTIPFGSRCQNVKVKGELYCDRFYKIQNNEDYEHIYLTVDNIIYIFINKSRLTSQNIEGFKKWLQANPTTVYYELGTPTITPIEPISFDIKPLATMTINSYIAPISNHKVELNRASQIERGIVEIAKLKDRVEVLEKYYDSHLLETQHKLSLLGFEYSLESEEV